jgi:hypothetical protein
MFVPTVPKFAIMLLKSRTSIMWSHVTYCGSISQNYEKTSSNVSAIAPCVW